MFQRYVIVAIATVAAILSNILSFNFTQSASAKSEFRLPVGPSYITKIFQGNYGDVSHKAELGQQYAFDFTAEDQPEFVVVAAHDGRIISSEETSTTHCFDNSCWTKGNYVLIDNGDRTTSLYLHLKKGSVRVHEGDMVKRGDPVAQVGLTGYTTGLHLHYQRQAMPADDDLKNKPAGWWFTQSLPVTFSNPEVLAQKESGDGVPKEGQTFKLSGKPIATEIKPGGLWISPKNGETVHDVLKLSARAYPTYKTDPLIDHVNFTLSSKGQWQILCEVPASETGDEFTCEVNLKELRIAAGKIQVSFDVTDKEKHLNKAPNGVNTLTYVPTPEPVSAPTQSGQTNEPVFQKGAKWYGFVQELKDSGTMQKINLSIDSVQTGFTFTATLISPEKGTTAKAIGEFSVIPDAFDLKSQERLKHSFATDDVKDSDILGYMTLTVKEQVAGIPKGTYYLRLISSLHYKHELQGSFWYTENNGSPYKADGFYITNKQRFANG